MTATLEGAPVLVTGATGFLGGALARRLATGGARVTGTGRDLAKAADLRGAGVELVSADLRRHDGLPALVEGRDVVFHAAAALQADAETGRAVNVEATEALARAAAAAGVRRLVHVSTVGAYDMEGRDVVDETAPLAVDHPATYPRTKARAEEALARVAADTDLEVAVVRPSMVYGPGDGIWTTGMYGNVCKGDPVFLGDGSFGFNPVYLDDVVDALLRCAVEPGAAGEAFNVSAEVTTWKRFMSGYGELCGKEPKGIPVLVARAMALANRIPGISTPVDRGFVEMATSHKTFPVKKARSVLGWAPTVSLEEGMERTLEWLRGRGGS